ncbi:MAG TPA: rhodanese-like domain-containing protein [Thermotogota bacterium]|nr:rhodanese-like domain-containing protein [Thermotogota bacterium]HRW91443.1 rhodanese-like domain-containing protein [Thermotogota bacterium]
MKKTHLWVLLLSMLSFLLFAQTISTEGYLVDNRYDEAFEAAQLLEKGVLVLFSLPTCQDCQNLKNYTLQSPQVVEALRRSFVVVEVNMDSTKSGYFPIPQKKPLLAKSWTYEQLFSQYGIRRTPTVAFYNPQLDYLGTLSGFFNPEQFLKSFPSNLSPVPRKTSVDVRLLSTEQATLLANTLPDLYLSDLNELKSAVQSGKDFDPDTPLLIWGASLVEVSEQLKKLPVVLQNAFVTKEKPVVEQKSGASKEQASFTTSGFLDISPSEALQLFEERKNDANFVVLDVRTASEFAGGHIPGAVNIDFYSTDFEQQLAQLDPRKSYLLYCRSGGRSSYALPKMVALGFQNVFHFVSGFASWTGPVAK